MTRQKGIDIKWLNDSICAVDLPEDLVDLDETPVLNGCTFARPVDNGYLLLGFSGVRMVNGLGASMLVKLAALAKRRSQRVIAYAVNDHYRNVLKVTGLDRAIGIYPTAEAVRERLGLGTIALPEGSPAEAPLDTEFWARPVSRLAVGPLPTAALNLNVEGREVVGPVMGLGPLWQKCYTLPIEKPDLSPEQVIRILKENLPSFQPPYNRFYVPKKGIRPGEVIAIDSSTPGGPVSTGVMVLYSDETSFTFITPQGHPESGWVTFIAGQDGNRVIARIVGLARANDLVYEVAFRAAGSRMQVRIWRHVLTSLSAYLGVAPDVTVEAVEVDPSIQWSQAGNVWYNAQIRTLFNTPRRWLSQAKNVSLAR